MPIYLNFNTRLHHNMWMYIIMNLDSFSKLYTEISNPWNFPSIISLIGKQKQLGARVRGTISHIFPAVFIITVLSIWIALIFHVLYLLQSSWDIITSLILNIPSTQSLPLFLVYQKKRKNLEVQFQFHTCFSGFQKHFIYLLCFLISSNYYPIGMIRLDTLSL